MAGFGFWGSRLEKQLACWELDSALVRNPLKQKGSPQQGLTE